MTIFCGFLTAGCERRHQVPAGREVVHFQRFGEAVQLLREKLDQKECMLYESGTGHVNTWGAALAVPLSALYDFGRIAHLTLWKF